MTPTNCPKCNSILSHSLGYQYKIESKYCAQKLESDLLGYSHYIANLVDDREFFRFYVNNNMFEVTNFNIDNTCDILIIKSDDSPSLHSVELFYTCNYILPYPKIEPVIKRLLNLKAFI